MRRFAAQTIDAVFFRWQVHAAQLRRRTTWPLPEDIDRLRTRSWRVPWMGDPGPPDVSLLEVEDVRRFEFASSEPFAQRHDQVAGGRLYEPQGTPRGAVVLVPGALTGAPWNGAERLYPRVAEAFTALGLVAARIELPLHESRAPAGEISGHEMFQGDLFTYVRAVAQAVRDVRSLAVWLRNEYGSVGVWGLSIGALIAALAAERDARLAWAVLAQPTIRAGSAWGSPITAPMREHMQASGVTREEVEMVLHGLAPVGPPALGASRVLLQGGRWDRLATAESLAELGRRWPGAEVRLYDGGHISMAIRNQWLEDGSEFIARLPGA